MAPVEAARMRAIFGRCSCGTITVWQDDEPPRWTCHRCVRVAQLATPAEQGHASDDSWLSDAQACLKRVPPPVSPTHGPEAELPSATQGPIPDLTNWLESGILFAF